MPIYSASKAPDHELRAKLDDARIRVSLAETDCPYWVHIKSERTYRVLDVGYRESDLEVLVMYEQEGSTGLVWVRPIDEFLDRFVLAGIQD